MKNKYRFIKCLFAALSSVFLVATTVTTPALAEAKETLTGLTDLPGVEWSSDHATCTLTGSVDGAALKQEIAQYNDKMVSFLTVNGSQFTGSARGLFKDCKKLEMVDLSQVSFTTGDLAAMFQGCDNLTTIMFPSVCDTTMVNYANSIFENCVKLQSVSFPDSFDLSGVTTMASMFSGCSELTSVRFPNPLVLTNVIMGAMFLGCSKLSSLDLSLITFRGECDCSAMFANCDSLEELNLGNLTVPQGEKSLLMFANLSSLIDADPTIYGGIPNLKKITMNGSCILEPGAGDTLSTGSGTFFDYKEPEAWSAYYQGDNANTTSAVGAMPDATLVGFDEFKAYQESHPGVTTYVLGNDPAPGPTPEPVPDAAASETSPLPNTGDALMSCGFASIVVAVGCVLLGGLFFFRRNTRGKEHLGA